MVNEVFHSRETMVLGDADIVGSATSCHHEGVGGERHGERLNDLKQMPIIFNLLSTHDMISCHAVV